MVASVIVVSPNRARFCPLELRGQIDAAALEDEVETIRVAAVCGHVPSPLRAEAAGPARRKWIAVRVTRNGAQVKSGRRIARELLIVAAKRAPARLSARVSLLPRVPTAFLSALEQARLIREQAVSPVEIVEEYLERIERIDPVLNSYVTVCADEALAQARDPRPGPFSGVPLP